MSPRPPKFGPLLLGGTLNEPPSLVANGPQSRLGPKVEGTLGGSLPLKNCGGFEWDPEKGGNALDNILPDRSVGPEPTNG